MNLDTLLPLLDAVSKLAESLPFPYVALGGAVLAAVALVLRKWKAVKPAPVIVASQTLDAPTPPKAALSVVADTTLEDITKQTLDPK